MSSSEVLSAGPYLSIRRIIRIFLKVEEYFIGFLKPLLCLGIDDKLHPSASENRHGPLIRSEDPVQRTVTDFQMLLGSRRQKRAGKAYVTVAGVSYLPTLSLLTGNFRWV
jgi:hypothetical protein